MTAEPLRSTSSQLAQFVGNLRYEELPADVVELAGLALLDTLGAALAGSGAEEAIGVRRSVQDLAGGTGNSLIWGTADHAPLPLAALANGTAAHSREIDDFGGCAHSGSVVIPAAIGTAASVGAGGRELLTAVVAGYDVAHRAMDGGGGYLAFKKRGWHSTPICGAFGAAAAAGRLLSLSTEQMQWALGFAGSSAGGTWAFIGDGSMSKRVHPGLAAQAGVIAATLARNNVTAPTDIFEAKWGGFYPTFVPDEATPERAVADLDQDFRIRLIGFKPYAACRGIHSSVDAVFRLLKVHDVRAEHVSRVVVRGSAIHVRQLSRQEVRTVMAAQMSLPYSIAASLLAGAAGMDQYTPAALQRPDVLALAKQVDVVRDETVADGAEPFLDFHLIDGRVVTECVPVARGDCTNPLTAGELRAKFRVTAGQALPPDQVAELEAAVMDVGNMADIRELVGLLRPRR